MRRLYHLIVRRKDGTPEYQTRYPMPHRECMTMRSKFSRPNDAELLETADPRPLERCSGCGDYHPNVVCPNRPEDPDPYSSSDGDCYPEG